MLAGASVRVGVARGPDWAACAGAEPAVIVTAAVAPAPNSPDKTSVTVSGRQRPSRRAFRGACRGGPPEGAVGSGPGTGGIGTGGIPTGGTGAGLPAGVAVVIVSGAAACARVTGSGSHPAAG